MSYTKVNVILVPVDGSKGSLDAVKLAATMAQAMNKPMELLHAFPKDGMEMFGRMSYEPTEAEVRYMNPAEFEKLRQKSSRDVFQKSKAVLGDSVSVSVKEVMLSGHPAEAVLDHAKSADSPMIVVGSRGLSNFKGMLVGSISQSLVHNATCPVTVVR